MLVLTPYLMKAIAICIGIPLVITFSVCAFVVYCSSKTDMEANEFESDSDIREWPEIKRPVEANQN